MGSAAFPPITLLDLVNAVAECTQDDSELRAVVMHMLGTGIVRKPRSERLR